MNPFTVKIKKLLNQIPADISKDQYFLDKKYFPKLIRLAGINKNDRVLEIGPGFGFLTEKLSHQAKEVFAIEIDKRFKPYLNRLPSNVEIIYGDAYKLLNNKKFLRETKPPTKTIANIPYSQAQNMLHNYTSSSWYQGDIFWISPLSLVNKINKEPILSAYFKAELIEKIPKKAFVPQPKTSSAFIHFKRIINPIISKDLKIYLRRFLYNHENWKVKNALREGIIRAAYDLEKIKITKNQAREIIKKLAIPQEELNKLTNNLKPDYYSLFPLKIERFIRQIEHFYSLPPAYEHKNMSSV